MGKMSSRKQKIDKIMEQKTATIPFDLETAKK